MDEMAETRALRILKYVLKFGRPSHPGISSMPEEKPSPAPEGPPAPGKPEKAERGGKKKDEEKEEPKRIDQPLAPGRHRHARESLAKRRPSFAGRPR